MPLLKISRKLIFVAQGGFGTFGTKPAPARPPGDVDEEKPSGEWEDIYGRKRDSKGNVIPAAASDPTEAGQGGVEGASKPTKYVPPAMRNLGGGRYGH